MNQNELEVAAEERLFDAMLDEVVRGARGVDAASPGGADHGSPWLAAAMVLFGVIVVAGVFVVTQAQRSAEALARTAGSVCSRADSRWGRASAPRRVRAISAAAPTTRAASRTRRSDRARTSP